MKENKSITLRDVTREKLTKYVNTLKDPFFPSIITRELNCYYYSVITFLKEYVELGKIKRIKIGNRTAYQKV